MQKNGPRFSYDLVSDAHKHSLLCDVVHSITPEHVLWLSSVFEITDLIYPSEKIQCIRAALFHLCIALQNELHGQNRCSYDLS